MEDKVILIVEDDSDILTVLKDQLILDGFAVFGVLQGEEGLKLIQKIRPHLLILDLNLPDMDGIRLCKRVREISDVPVIMLTVRDAISDKLRGFEAGADDYVTKPFEYLELAARIRACLRGRSEGRSLKKILDMGRIRIIPSKREVYVDGDLIRLTAKEYELLDLLARHAGKVLSRDFIKTQIWKGKEIYPWSRALDVHIQRLRRKIEPDPENPRFIITHSGVGYRFEPGE